MSYEQPAAPMKPVVNHETGEVPHHTPVVWWSRLDNRFPVEVHRLDIGLAERVGIKQDAYDPDYEGVLCIFDEHKAGDLIHVERVGLAYGALFGPDVEDVYRWQQATLKFIDEAYRDG